MCRRFIVPPGPERCRSEPVDEVFGHGYGARNMSQTFSVPSRACIEGGPEVATDSVVEAGA